MKEIGFNLIEHAKHADALLELCVDIVAAVRNYTKFGCYSVERAYEIDIDREMLVITYVDDSNYEYNGDYNNLAEGTIEVPFLCLNHKNLIQRCIDTYIKNNQENYEKNRKNGDLDEEEDG